MKMAVFFCDVPCTASIIRVHIILMRKYRAFKRDFVAMTEAVSASETPDSIYQNIQCNIPKGSHLRRGRAEGKEKLNHER
jgi:hypothetical protein